MLTEDQMLILADVKKSRATLVENHWVGGAKTNSVRLFIDGEHKTNWLKELSQKRQEMQRWMSTSPIPKELNIVERIRNQVLNESETLEDVHRHIEGLVTTLQSLDWAKLLDIRETIREEFLSEKMQCSECARTMNCASLYAVNNRIPRQWSEPAAYYCLECLGVIHDRIFPYCIMCNRRYEVETLNDDFEFCQICRQIEKYREERIRVKKHLERAKLCGATASLTIPAWITTLDHFDWKCAYCKGPFESLEHYISLPFGGTTIDNCVPSCRKCNSKKRNLPPHALDSIFPAENLARIRSWFAQQQIQEAS